eukprot:gene2765-4173_t
MLFETSETHPLAVDFIDQKYLNNNNNSGLGMCMIPGRNKKRHKRDLDSDLSLILNKYNAQTLVTLVREEELKSMGLDDYFKIVTEKYQLNSYHFPIKDKWLPENLGMCKTVDFILSEMNKGNKVTKEFLNFFSKTGDNTLQWFSTFIFDNLKGGKGRAATISTGVLMAGYGYSSSQAMKIVQKTRNGTLQNPIQQLYLEVTFPLQWKKFNK